MMKIGFSSLICPTWNLETIVTRASELGFDGIELRGLCGELHLPMAAELSGDADGVRKLLQDHNVELVCLGASPTLTSRDSSELARQKSAIIEFIELAARLGCPNVRIFVGEVPRRDDRQMCLSRVAAALISLVPVATRNQVTLLIENGGDYCSSSDLWFLVDAVGHPAIQACWSQCHAMSLSERPTNSIPRLGGKIGLVHVCDADFDEQGVLLDYQTPGQGQTEISRQIELLKGMMYNGYLMFEWPKLWVDALPAAETVLPDVVSYLHGRLDNKHKILTAYKNDKNAPRLSPGLSPVE